MKKSPLTGVKNALLGLSLKELEKFVVELGEAPFRGRQLHDWLYEKGARDIGSITVLPKDLRVTLGNRGVVIGRLSEVNRVIAKDMTTKLLLQTYDKENIETVGIPTNTRLTVCVSSQVGCSMGCHFCATGKGGLERSLATHEIVDQVISVREAMKKRPSHVVFMGMGEPLLNCDSVLSSIRCLNDDLGISQRRITISTVGVPRTIERLAQMAIQRLGRAKFTLAVSLHAPNQELREKLIPTARSYPIDLLLEDCRNYVNVTGRRVSFEYILLGELNDGIEHANELSTLIGGFQSHVNLIAYNPIQEESYKRPSSKKIDAFKSILENRGIAVSLRASRGLDQNAACGQLRQHHAKKTARSLID